MESSSGSSWSADEPAGDLIDDVPNQLLVALLTTPSHLHQSRVTSRKPLAPHMALTKVAAIPWATRSLLREEEGGVKLARNVSADLPSLGPPTNRGKRRGSAEPEHAPPRKRPRVALEEKIRIAICTPPSVPVTEEEVSKVVSRIAAAVRGCGDDAGLVAGLVVNGLSDPLNTALRVEILTGKMTPERLVTLNDEDFLNPERREVLQALRQERMDQRSVDFIERLTTPITSMFTCPACGCKECFANFRSTDFVKWQGDDPNPTLLTCTACGLAFKE